MKAPNVLGLIEVAEKLGFEAKGVRGELDSLFKIPKPAIAHLIVKKNTEITQIFGGSYFLQTNLHIAN
ncbi:cysteine peptidase family C39 domain-containing protein [Polaribacter cellanae]|uniref:Peptidase C39 domain-containing protein n=1 Tax=Polaribacter cellanae TaxID=2818493 RepID=A0A975CNF6_9FLAO|nr:cysteine peptidase family C39 domain-containing protein [Polaribacter cellanae]QTE22435.1 hypothetical protein J3359_16780 [Polaribacter cellanae]